ncbi:MAG TPA: CmcI family methyltransferase [Archangium sp.]|uniref:CmcI family methyltransferase n=1 Tax=Archangium sp. TaxID=1872627 RepID=UPI002ED99B8B
MKQLIDDFHALYFGDMVTREYEGGGERWMGVPIRKMPLDLWVYQELIHETRPDVIIETGTMFGGSALYFAHLCELLGNGRVITIDLQPQPSLPQHARIEYLTGSSVDPTILERVRSGLTPGQKVMVILDSDHSAEHVLKELHCYSGLVTPGQYLIVEDTNIGHPLYTFQVERGPMEAVEEFLAGDTPFERDRGREKLLVTFNPGGYLKRVR